MLLYAKVCHYGMDSWRGHMCKRRCEYEQRVLCAYRSELATSATALLLGFLLTLLHFSSTKKAALLTSVSHDHACGISDMCIRKGGM